jgi:hypothetical protein
VRGKGERLVEGGGGEKGGRGRVRRGERQAGGGGVRGDEEQAGSPV